MNKERARTIEMRDTAWAIFYDDALAYLKWAIKKKKSPEEILLNLMHDIGGMARMERCFVPRVSGWAKALKEKANV